MEMKGAQRPRRPYPNAARQRRDENKPKFVDNNQLFIDQFVNLKKCLQPRTYVQVAKDMYPLWKANPLLCTKFTAYTRMITRKCRITTPEGVIQLDTQQGEGLKNEGIMRMLWLAIYHKPTFHANIAYFAAAGCWKDFITMMALDVQLHGFKHRLDWDFFKKVIFAGLANGQTCDLVKKYLPRVRSSVACKTDEAKARNTVAKFLAEGLYGKPKDEGDYSTYRKYRKMKNSGKAAQWQQLISQKKFLEIDFDTVTGKALAQLVGSKFLKHQGLKEKYQNWLKNRKKPSNSGFLHTLFKPYGLDKIAEEIPEFMETSINASFNVFVDNAKRNRVAPLLVVRDISHSANGEIENSETSAYSLGKVYALYHSELLPTIFKNSYAVLEDNMVLRKFKGQNVIEKWKADKEEALCQNPSIISIADMLCKMKEDYGVDEGEFPRGCVVITNHTYFTKSNNQAFVEFKQRLLKANFSKEFVRAFKVIIWRVPLAYKGRPNVALVPGVSNCFLVNGLNNSTSSFITGEKRFQVPKTTRDIFKHAMNQELLNMMILEKDVVKKNARVQKKPVKV